MTASRDREEKDGAGAIARPEVSSAELSEQIERFCLQARTHPAEMHARFQAQQRELLARLPAGRIQ